MKARIVTGTGLLQALGATWRIDVRGEEHLEAARRASPRGNVIYTLWHRSLLILAYTHRRRDIQILVSQHRDGGWIAGILARMGYGLVRGSSRRGGVEALFRLATVLEEGLDVGVTVDGPVGPRYSVHPGVALLARRTGRPIVPLTATYRRGVDLPTWDGLRVPAPGTHVEVTYAPAVWAQSASGVASVPALQEQVGGVLGDLTREQEARYGRSIDLVDVQDRRSWWERAGESRRPRLWLRAASRVYGGAVRVERVLRPRPPGRASRPWVIGIGNLEAGGTGKTPCLALLAGALAQSGLQVAILTRGHGGALGRRPEFVDAAALARASDETRWLVATLGPQVPVLVARDKAAGLERLRRRQALDVVIVDDAFQTSRLRVDRHLVLLDWAEPWGNGWLLPAGRLREPPAALGRAAALLFTRARGPTPPLVATGAAHRVPRFVAFEEDAGLHTPAGATFDAESLRGQGVATACGIGRPQAFERLVAAVAARHGFAIRRRVRVGDHAAIEPALRRLAARLAALDCTHIVVTAKDAARLGVGSQWNEPLLVLEQRLVIPDLVSLLDCLCPQRSSSSAKLAKMTESEA
jgi:tetraacyldisaccharide 4'-kinase